jgi:sterol desaturase/sphingolipid hydroxylase (fatty acid hydroxylase superfamily)
MNMAAVKAGLKLVGYGAVVVIALASGEFAFCVAYGFLLVEAAMHAYDTYWVRGGKHHESDERTVVSAENPHPLPGPTRRMGVGERAAEAHEAGLSAVRKP